MATLLLEKGAHTKLRDSNGRQAIHIVTALGNLDLLQKLLDCDPSLLNSPVTKEAVDGEESITCVHVELTDFSISDAISKVNGILLLGWGNVD